MNSETPGLFRSGRDPPRMSPGPVFQLGSAASAGRGKPETEKHWQLTGCTQPEAAPAVALCQPPSVAAAARRSPV
eukprot:CAMPEP_0202853300 /NCGR_PEP_ID=MMETSP1389-20130828/90413_1 /ASSEMBLY_ACC=CAM_ASM_000865 /TAXON_ID=302021 /ORGANISM="Rhodomonas sp., Strain CCMP768" /LENGTH=74 /DNA_ID=CAMNT_0049531849 /DNA_START=193 /DNA_END=417 /DNA_ORIENTATION=+